MALLISVFPAIASANSEDSKNGVHRFKDVSENHWAFDQITWMVNNKIVEGDGSGNFYPTREVSRDEYAKMMVLTLRLKLINPDVPSFKDVKGNGWQYKYIETARPYMTGFRAADGDYFHPSAPAVREDMAVALVKALGFGGETADESILSAFNDSGSISPNIRKYVAIAVKHGLMQGYEQDGKRLFGPQASLNRASAAQLLYAAFKGNEEKITFDEEKVTFDDGDPAVDSDYITPKVCAEIVDGIIRVSWDKITSSKFTGYKVVVSKNDSTPSYPENGYFQYITNSATTYTILQAGDSYNGGDVGGKLQGGTEYYFSVTALYGDKKVAGNVVKLEMPGDTTNTGDGYTVPNVSAQVVGDHVVMSWDKITSSRFAGYKVVISKSDSTPKYPDNGYFEYITDRDTVSTAIHAGDGYNGGDFDGELQSGESYYFSITVLYGDRNVAGNVIRLQLP